MLFAYFSIVVALGATEGSSNTTYPKHVDLQGALSGGRQGALLGGEAGREGGRGAGSTVGGEAGREGGRGAGSTVRRTGREGGREHCWGGEAGRGGGEYWVNDREIVVCVSPGEDSCTEHTVEGLTEGWVKGDWE